MKLSIDTDVDTFDSALKAVHAAFGQAFPATNSADGGDDDGYLPSHWTRPRLRKLVEWLGDSDAAAAVRYIAEHAPSVSLDDTYQHMSEHTGIDGFDGKHMGGRMSAVGFARNAIGGGVGPIYDTDYNSRKYRMDKKLAAALLEELDAYEES